MIKFFVIVYIASTVRSHSYNIGRPQTFDQYDNLNRFSTYSFRILMSLSIGAHVSEETCCVAKKISTRQPITKWLLPYAILLVVKRQVDSRLLPERSKSTCWSTCEDQFYAHCSNGLIYLACYNSQTNLFLVFMDNFF